MNLFLWSLISTLTCLQFADSQPLKINDSTECSYFSSNLNCGTNAVCGLVQGKQRCICKFGYLPKRPDNIDCIASKCTYNDECEHNFGPNTKCGHEKGNYCDCRLFDSLFGDVFFDRQTQRCVPKHEISPIECSNDAHCGSGMECSKNGCVCKANHKLHRNGYDCDETVRKCSSNAGCEILNFEECTRNVCQPWDGITWCFMIFVFGLFIVLFAYFCYLIIRHSIAHPSSANTCWCPRTSNYNSDNYSLNSYSNRQSTSFGTHYQSSHHCTSDEVTKGSSYTTTHHYNHEKIDNTMPSYDDV